jgi:hypothetical protein
MESFSFKESMATLQSLVSLTLESPTLEDQLCIQHYMLKDLRTLKRDFGSLKQPGAFFQELPQRFLEKMLFRLINSQGQSGINDFPKQLMKT